MKESFVDPSISDIDTLGLSVSSRPPYETVSTNQFADPRAPHASNDIGVLEDAGIVHFREGKGRAKAPLVPYERVHIEAEVTAAGEK